MNSKTFAAVSLLNSVFGTGNPACLSSRSTVYLIYACFHLHGSSEQRRFLFERCDFAVRCFGSLSSIHRPSAGDDDDKSSHKSHEIDFVLLRRELQFIGLRGALQLIVIVGVPRGRDSRRRARCLIAKRKHSHRIQQRLDLTAQ